jgi:hypothetical protein
MRRIGVMVQELLEWRPRFRATALLIESVALDVGLLFRLVLERVSRSGGGEEQEDRA